MLGDIAATMSGKLVTLEPLASVHEEGLYRAAQDMDWSLMPLDPSADTARFNAWLNDALDYGARGEHVPFAVLATDSGEPLGSTRYLSLRIEHRGLEIGWTWLTRPAWSTGANVEAKLLLLEHAFERLGCMRVEFKTDANNQRSRRVAGTVRGHLAKAHARRQRPGAPA